MDGNACYLCGARLKLGELFDLVRSMELDTQSDVYDVSDGTRLFLRRPKEVSKKLKNEYDPKTNIQIWAKEPGKDAFKPNHLRLLTDLIFLRRARPDKTEQLLSAFDDVFYGEDPCVVYDHVKNIELPDLLRPLDYDLCLHQLFIAEQAIGYKRESQFEPKYLFLQGYVRAILCGYEEVDKLLWSATSKPPSPRYTKEDDSNRKEFNKGRKRLWYLENERTRQEQLFPKP